VSSCVGGSYELGSAEKRGAEADFPSADLRTLQDDIVRMQNVIVILSEKVGRLEGLVVGPEAGIVGGGAGGEGKFIAFHCFFSRNKTTKTTKQTQK